MRHTNQYAKPLSDRHAVRREQKAKYDRRERDTTRHTTKHGKFTVPNTKE